MKQYRTRPFRKSLRGKIVLMMLLVSLVPLIITGAIMYSSMASTESSANDSVDESRSNLKENTVAATKASQAWNVSVDIETWMASKIKEIQSWTSNTVVIDAVKEGGAANLSAAQTFLGDKKIGDADIGDAYIVDSSYQLVTHIPGGKSSINTTVAREAWGVGLSVSELQSAEGQGVSYPYYVDVAIIIEDLTEEIPLGVLVASVKVHPSSLARDYGAKVPRSRLIVWATINDQHKLVIDSQVEDRVDSDNISYNKAEQQVINSVKPSIETIVPIDDDGNVKKQCTVITDSWIGGYARASNNYEVAEVPFQFSEYDGLGWLAFVEQDTDTALQPLESLDKLENDLNSATNNMLYTLIGVIVGLLIIVPIIAYYVSRGITNPIAHLRDAAEKVSMGDMSVIISVETDDEIGDLAQSFDRMVMAVRFLSQEEEE